MNKWILLLITTVLLVGCSNSGSEAGTEDNNKNGSGGDSYRQISTSEAAELMETEEGYIILDVRTPDEFRERHIPGAINIPNETIGGEAPSELPDKDQLILVYCRSGNRSKQAAAKLSDMGYVNIVEFGGINDWTGETTAGDE